MKSVLLIDDHVMFREGLGLLLGQRLGPIRLLEAGSLHLGMRLLAAQDRPVDLVLLDLELRDSRGLATFERLRQSCPQLPVLVLSGSVDEMPAAELIERGAAGCCSRPRLPSPNRCRRVSGRCSACWSRASRTS